MIGNMTTGDLLNYAIVHPSKRRGRGLGLDSSDRDLLWHEAQVHLRRRRRRQRADLECRRALAVIVQRLRPTWALRRRMARPAASRAHGIRGIAEPDRGGDDGPADGSGNGTARTSLGSEVRAVEGQQRSTNRRDRR